MDGDVELRAASYDHERLPLLILQGQKMSEIEELKHIWWELNAIDKKLRALIAIGAIIAALLFVSVIHHW